MRVSVVAVSIVIVVLACAAALAGPQNFSWQLRGGLHTAGSTHPALGADYTSASEHPGRVINWVSADWLDIDHDDGWLLNVGHRWADSRAGLNIGLGLANLSRSRVGGKAVVDYALNDNVALSAGYFKDGWHAHSKYGHGFLLQVGYRF